ncbi:hypothetical protein HDU89_005458 [Geranomyces variabilis]|nr:hypothetical protein HDU89_005458 [Geranomyces variabilis]
MPRIAIVPPNTAPWQRMLRLSSPRHSLRPASSFSLSTSFRSCPLAHYSTTPSHDDPPPEQQLTLVQRFGKPIGTLLLYSSLALITLQYVWTRLTFEETREKEAARIAALEQELLRLKEIKAENERLRAEGAAAATVGSSNAAPGNGRRWWVW